MLHADVTALLLGERSAEYQNGKVISRKGSWLAGVNGASPGIIMQGNPQLNRSYNQENVPGVAEDHARILSLDGSASVPFGTYNGGLLVTLETTKIEPGQAEDKSYAAGVGQVQGVDLVSGEVDQLIQINHGASISLPELVQRMSTLRGAQALGSSASQ